MRLMTGSTIWVVYCAFWAACMVASSSVKKLPASREFTRRM